MLITVSGMVGSGKTTAAAQIQRILEDDGAEAVQWRFQSLPCFALLRRSAAPRRSHDGGPQARRWTGYRRKRLTLRATAIYAGRIMAFRLFRIWRGTENCQVVNRYFYDNFVHYELKTPLERVLAALLQRAIPVPDVAILLVASPEAIAVRRPQYSVEYLSMLHESYAALRRRFPDLVEISTDPGQPTFDRLEAALRQRRSSRRRGG